MLTGRGWWCLVTVSLMLLVGVLGRLAPLAGAGMALLLWFGWEWLLFAVRLRGARLHVEREVSDERGPVVTLWSGRSFEVRARLRMAGSGYLPYVAVADPVPFALEHEKGLTAADGELSAGSPLEVRYTVRCPGLGQARFEGLRVEVADLHGFFYHAAFVRDPVALRVLPAVSPTKARVVTGKRHNRLPPPGLHRLRQPGSGSELLDLRDYQPGDPPRTIAWKVSARRDKLITKEFEGEVPVRCTLFVDASQATRAASPVGRRRPGAGKPLDRLLELGVGVLQANASQRDMTGLCLFDDGGVLALVPPDRSPRHHNALVQQLADAGALAPSAARVNPDELTPLAYALAQELYPELLRPAVNAMPGWLTWFVAFPRYSRRWLSFVEYLHRRKVSLLLLCTSLLPLALTALNLVALATDALPDWAMGALFQASLFALPLLVAGAWFFFLLSLLISGRLRRLARQRKRLAALLSVRYGLAPGGLDTMLEDDDQFALHLQRFLAEHQVPYAVPLYDGQGRYTFASPDKVGVLAKALTRSVARARDNELFVILADLLEVDDHLEPLVQAARVAMSRHHQVMVVCAWPPGLAPPNQPARDRAPRGYLHVLLGRFTTQRLHDAYARLRRTFARLGVTVVLAESDEPVRLVLDRIERLRQGRGRRG